MIKGHILSDSATSQVCMGSSRARSIFWTGGWDSTFRVLDLVLRHGEVVEPWYVQDPTRESTKQEMATMERLCSLINSRAPNRALTEIKILEASDAQSDPILREKFEKLKKKRGIGPQYIWLAELAKQYGLEGIEVCVQYNEDFFFLDPNLVSGTRNYKKEPVRPQLPPEEPESLFNCFSFPTLHIGKAEMREHARRYGFLDLLEKTWFCHMPTRKGDPCGFCTPCRMVVSKGVGYRLPWRAKINNHIIRALEASGRGYRARRWLKYKMRGY